MANNIHVLLLRVQASRVVFNPGNAATGPINVAELSVSGHSGLFPQIMLGQ